MGWSEAASRGFASSLTLPCGSVAAGGRSALRPFGPVTPGTDAVQLSYCPKA